MVKPTEVKKTAEPLEAEAIPEKEIEKIVSLVEGIPTETAERAAAPENKFAWNPKTSLGKRVKSGEITDLGYILDSGEKILEPEIVEALLPDIQNDLLLIGQARGKFGGGQRRVFKTVQKKSRDGNKPRFATAAVVGNGDGFVGLGYGKSKETVPAREKSVRKAKLNIIKIRRGCGSWKCNCGEPHSIPYETKGKCGSSEITIMPAPKGAGLKVEKECAKILKLAGIKDAWSKTSGQTSTKINLIRACMEALKNLAATKTKPEHIEQLGIVDGHLKQAIPEDKEFIEKIKAPKEIEKVSEAEE
jgi:small subunit ribosomal protein S5